MSDEERPTVYIATSVSVDGRHLGGRSHAADACALAVGSAANGCVTPFEQEM